MKQVRKCSLQRVQLVYSKNISDFKDTEKIGAVREESGAGKSQEIAQESRVHALSEQGPGFYYMHHMSQET